MEYNGGLETGRRDMGRCTINEWKALLEQVRSASDRLRGRTDPMARCLSEAASRMLYLASMEEKVDGEYFDTASMDVLARDNAEIFRIVEGDDYARSLENPSVAIRELGRGPGQAFALWRSQIESCGQSLFRHDLDRLSNVFGVLPALVSLDGPEGIPAVVAEASRKGWAARFLRNNLERMDPAFTFYRDTVFAAVPGDRRYLYRYGVRITKADMDMAAHVESLSHEKADLIARTIVASYVLGFEMDGKDLSRKRTASLYHPAGFERIGRKIDAEMTRHSLRTIFSGIEVRQRNRQLNYDHRFAWALFLDEATRDAFVSDVRRGFEEAAPHPAGYSGPMFIDTFGEEPFSPVPNPDAISPSAEVNTLYRELSMKLNELVDGFCPRAETGFVMADFPSPEIRGDFRAIFDETVEMNTLDNDEYLAIHKVLIDALDSGEKVRVKGAPGNRTDLEIALHHLDDPSRQTNFVNCVATVNIPVGEVFTSPVLKGSSGTLHVEEAFLDGLKYRDLVIEFRDGYMADYGCANFPDPEEGRKYVYENLIHPHKTLPIGEFAIGTNTFAYRMATRHGIMDLLTVLILEKTGPHLAIGDTCFSWEEDHPVHNPLDGKEVIARENEKTCLRKTDPMEAYTSKHTDITLPYRTLGSISAVAGDGSEVFLFRDGRFVLPGTEKLNEALGD